MENDITTSLCLRLVLSLIRGGSSGNIIVSPSNILMALGMLFFATDGNTRSRMIKFLTEGTSKEFSDIEEFFKGSLEEYFYAKESNENPDNNFLMIGNKLYTGHKIKESYKEDLIRYFKSECETVDFSNRVYTCDLINEWVSNKTLGKIPTLLYYDLVSSQTRAILVSTIFFRAEWRTEFDPLKTIVEQFYLTPDSSTPVKMMKAKKSYNYLIGHENLFSVIELEYRWNEFSAIIVLPNENSSIEQCIEYLKANESLTSVIENFEYGKVHLTIPKFKFEEKILLKHTLTTLGLSSIFDADADFTKMSDEEVFVSEFVHSATFEFDEKGVVASAASAIGIVTMSLPQPKRDIFFTVNRPFIVMVLNKQFLYPIFISVVYDPSK